MSEWIALRGVRRARSGYAARLREQMFSDFFSAIIWMPVELVIASARLRASGAEFDAYLRAGIDGVSPRDSRELLADILHSSSISTSRRIRNPRQIPKDSSDSISMTRNEAIALVLDAPPTDGHLPLTH